MSFVNYLSKCFRTFGILTLSLFGVCFGNLLFAYYRVHSMMVEASIPPEAAEKILRVIVMSTHIFSFFFALYLLVVFTCYYRERNKITNRNSVVIDKIQKLDLMSIIREPSHMPRGTRNEDIKEFGK